MEHKLDLILSELQSLNKGQKTLGEKLTAVEDRLATVEKRQVALEERLTAVEKGQTALEERQSVLESGQHELYRIVSAIRGNQLEARADFDRMQYDVSHIKGDIAEMKEILPTFVTREEQKRTEERLDVHTFQIARLQERLTVLEQRGK